MVNEPLETIHAKPTKMIQFGEYKRPNEGEKSTRSIKLAFDSHGDERNTIKEWVKTKENKSDV